MKPEEIKNLRDQLGRTQEGMALIVNTTTTSWGRWERGETTPLPIYQEKLDKLQEFIDRRQESGE